VPCRAAPVGHPTGALARSGQGDLHHPALPWPRGAITGRTTPWRRLAIKDRPRLAEKSGGFVPPGGTMERSADKRRSSRIRTRFEISYSLGARTGQGFLPISPIPVHY
jgi:hypothetical protein